MSEAPAVIERHLSGVHRIWHTVVLLGVAIVALLAARDATAWARVALVAGVVVLAWGYVGLVRGGTADGARASRRSASVAAGLAAMIVAAPTSILLVFGVVPALFFATSLPIAIALNSGLVGVSALSVTLHRVEGHQGVALALLIAGGLSILIAVWLAQVFRLTHRQVETIAQLRVSRSEARRLAHIAGAAGERARIAQDIHDGMAQQLSAITMLLRSASDMSERGRHSCADERTRLALRHSELALAECRFLIARRDIDETGDLLEVVAQLTSLFESTARMTTTVVLPDALDPDRAPDPATSLVAQRVLTEALSNCLRHSEAERVEVRLEASEHELHLSVHDDGRGFEIDDADDTGVDGFGLPGMRARARGLGGVLSIESEPGRGTRLNLCVPLRTVVPEETP